MIHTIVKNFTEIDCCKCGVIFCVPKNLDDSYRTTKNIFYCPNGHAQNYVKSTEQLLRENLSAAEGTIKTLHAEIEELRRKPRKKK